MNCGTREPALKAVRTKIGASDYEALESLAEKTRISIAAHMRAAVAEYLRANNAIAA